ncbi:hypothetical protein [Methylobacterium sp. JK268]
MRIRAEGERCRPLEHFPTKWLPVRRRKCGKDKDREQEPMAARSDPALEHFPTQRSPLGGEKGGGADIREPAARARVGAMPHMAGLASLSADD